ncbi:MAG: Rhs element Vgr protein [Massilia sp.]
MASRALTAGEKALAARVFGAAIDYAKVRIFSRRYIPFQPRNCAMTPNGSLYFHRSCHLADFSTARLADQHWFIHEMTHVWQHQLGYPVRLRGAVRLGLDYHYRLRRGATLSDFNMEAQGDLLADYFVLRLCGCPEAMRWRDQAVDPALFGQVLGGFLADPASRAHLPRWRRAA